MDFIFAYGINGFFVNQVSEKVKEPCFDAGLKRGKIDKSLPVSVKKI